MFTFPQCPWCRLRISEFAHEGTQMKSRFSLFLNDESGATAIEYSLIAALIGVAVIAAVKKLGTTLSTKFSGIAGNLT